MDFVDIIQKTNERKKDITREVELSTGHKVVIKDYIPISQQRAVALVISESAMVIREGEIIPRIDYALLDISRVYALVLHLTDIDIDKTDMNVFYDNIMISGLWEEISSHFDKDLVSKIDEYTELYIEETLRTQEIEGMLGYQINTIVDNVLKERDDSVEAFLKIAEEKGLDILGENPKTKKLDKGE